MRISAKLDALHVRARKNKWLRYFTVFNRIALAAGFIPSGMQKVLGERFTVLAVNHPMGNYLEAIYHTGYYYTSIGILQVTAAILLLIPRTATLGAMIYFPIILNIFILSHAVRFDGSLVTSPLMVLAVLYLLCWDYHKWKGVLPFNHTSANNALSIEKEDITNKFPKAFFAGVAATVFTVTLVSILSYDIMPRNMQSECRKQCDAKDNPEACLAFCDCIHEQGHSLNTCLAEYEEHPENISPQP